MADDTAEQLRALLADVVTVVSHELRQPLMVIQGYLSLVDDGALGEVPAEIGEIMPVVLNKVDEINAIIEQIVILARLEAGTLHSTEAPADLRSVVDTAVRRLEPVPATHPIAVRHPAGPVPVVVDSGHIETILENLLSNAVRFSPAGGEVTVTVGAENGAARVAVADRGIGITPTDLDGLFVRLGRIRNDRTRGIPGCGLGLVTARGLARRFGGDVEVVSEPGAGSVFTLVLPLAELD